MIRIGNTDANVEPDSGASANIMDEYEFRALHHKSKEIKELKLSRDILKTLQSTLTVNGEFQTTLRNQNQGATTKFLVIKGKMDSLPLLSKNTLVELGILRIDPGGTLKQTNELRIKVEQREANDLEELLNEYKEVFEGIGCIRYNKTGKEIEVKLEMDSAIPVAQKP